MTTPRAAIRPCVLVLVLVLGLAACGSDGGADGRTTDAQPGPHTSEFTSGNFDSLPRPEPSDPVGSKTEADGRTLQSFKARGMTPEQVAAFYDKTMPTLGWTAVEPVAGTAATDERLVRTYRHGDQELRVTALPAPTLSSTEGATDKVETQFSLELRPL
jgi:hypothetical protein